MKKKKQSQIYKDKNGRDFIKESYFVGGKLKFRRVYVIDGLPADEFYEKNATDLDFYLNEDYWLMESRKGPDHCNGQNQHDTDLSNKNENLPF